MTNYQRALDDVGHHSFDEQGRRLTVDAIAERMGVRASHMRKALSAYDETHPLNAAKVVALTHATGNLALVRYFAEACGCVLVALPRVDPDNVDVLAHSAKAIKEFSDVLQEASKALADGRVSRDEAAAFEKQAAEAQTAIAEFVQLMNIKAGIAPPPLPSRLLSAVARQRGAHV